MKYIVQTPFKVRAVHGEVTLQSGQVITLSNDKAMILIQQGKVSLADPEQAHAYQERAAIIEYDGGINRKEAERQAWCRHACMLFSLLQWKECQRFKPKPCLKLINQIPEVKHA